MLRDWLVFGLVGLGQIWLWFQGQSMYVSNMAPFSLFALISVPERISFTGSGFRARMGFFGRPFYPTVNIPRQEGKGGKVNHENPPAEGARAPSVSAH